MTTNTIFAVAGPFADIAGQRIEPATEYTLLLKAGGTSAILPANSIVTEVEIKRKATENDVSVDLTPGRCIAIGIDNFPRLLTGTPGILTDTLNQYDINPDNDNYHYPFVAKLVPNNFNFLLNSVSFTQDHTFVLQSGFGGNIISGGVSVVIKYKSFSESVVEKWK
jgi:hypothetical protein